MLNENRFIGTFRGHNTRTIVNELYCYSNEFPNHLSINYDSSNMHACIINSLIITPPMNFSRLDVSVFDIHAEDITLKGQCHGSTAHPKYART